MSLRLKINLAIISIFTLILFFITLNLWIDFKRRIVEENVRIGAIVRNIVEHLVLEGISFSDGTEDMATWSKLTQKLYRFRVFDKWLIIDDNFRVLSTNLPEYQKQIALTDPNLRRAFLEPEPFVENGNLYTRLFVLTHQPLKKVYVLKVNFTSIPYPFTNPKTAFMNSLIILSIGAVLILSSVYLLLTYFVLKPLEDLVIASRRVSGGDLNFKVPTLTGAQDEMGQLIQTFNKMLDTIRNNEANLKREIERVRNEYEKAQKELIIAQRLSATGTLATGVAHEINNPLAGVLNATFMLRDNPTKMDKYIQIIIDGLQRIQDIVRKVLQLAPGKNTEKLKQCYVQEIIEGILPLVKYKLEKKNIRLENKVCDKGSNETIFVVPQEMQQVFINLLINAADAIQHKNGLIKIDYQSKDGFIKIVVEDNGCGISKENQEKIFDPFWTTKSPGEGTGLGLFIVHQIINKYKGKINVFSEVNKGTRVEILMPAYPLKYSPDLPV